MEKNIDKTLDKVLNKTSNETNAPKKTTKVKTIKTTNDLVEEVNKTLIVEDGRELLL